MTRTRGTLDPRCQLESTIQHNIRLDLGKEPDLVLFRLQPGGLSDATGRPIRTAPKGTADLCGILTLSVSGHKFGTWFCLEVKTARGRVRKEQEQWGRMVRRMGGFYAVVRSVEQARAALHAARRGAKTWTPTMRIAA